jgi:serine/threonine-protein kinase
MGAAPHAKGELQSGSMVGDYRVEGVLAEGGMATVYAAVHPIIGKRAAIKVMSRDLCSDPHATERFVQEARAVNQIGHPNIVDVFTIGNLADGRSYLVMEWLQGETLGDRLWRAKIEREETAAILTQIADALEAAHEKGVVHRDLKPENVFLVPVHGGKLLVKLLDFGIAKLLDERAPQVDVTGPGSTAGTPAYMSPEQALGEAVDARSDIYALGVIAYEMFCGQVPFDGKNPLDVLHMQAYAKPLQPRELKPDVPEGLDALIMAMLDKDRSRRPSLAEVRSALAMPQAVVVAPPKRRAGFFALVLGGSFSVLALLGSGMLTGRAAPPPPPPAATPPARAPAPGVTPTPAPLAVPKAALAVSIEGAKAAIELDGVRVAKDAVSTRLANLAAGPHVLRVSAPRRVTFERELTLVAGETLHVEVKLGRPVASMIKHRPDYLLDYNMRPR